MSKINCALSKKEFDIKIESLDKSLKESSAAINESTNKVQNSVYSLLINELECFIQDRNEFLIKKFPTYSELYENFKSVPLNNIFNVDGLFTNEFLEFFFQHHKLLKILMPYMDLRHHKIIHFYLHFLP